MANFAYIKPEILTQEQHQEAVDKLTPQEFAEQILSSMYSSATYGTASFYSTGAETPNRMRLLALCRRFAAVKRISNNFYEQEVLKSFEKTMDPCWNIPDEIIEYSKEIGLEYDHCMTVQQLVNSHRTLRTEARRDNDERLAQITAARERAAAQAREEVTHGDYVSMERLKTMSMLEVAQLIHPGD